MNPLIRSWLKIWDKLTNKRYRHELPPYMEMMEREMLYFSYHFYREVSGDYARFAQIVDNHSLHPYFHYRHFTKPKKSGGTREIVEPDHKLKRIQSQISKLYLQRADVHPAAMGFRRKHSIADHAWAHVGAEVIITADIVDFFPNTSRRRVRDWWGSRVETEQLAELLTILTTYRGGLPQGAPSSPFLSNTVNYDMDVKLTRHTQQHGGNYTRYGDDMVFSWYHSPPADFEHAIRSVLREFGYEINAKKGWQTYHRADEPEITGVILRKHGKVEIPPELKRKIKQLERDDDQQARLAGYHGYQNMVENYKSKS